MVRRVPLPSSLTPGARFVERAAFGSDRRRGARVGIGGAPALAAPWPPGPRHRVVMAADVNAPRAAARKNRHQLRKSSTSRVIRPCGTT